MKTFSIELPDRENKEACDAFQTFMDAQADAWWAEANKIATELDIPIGLAGDFLYLRSRSRHSYETENRMIKCYRATGQLDFRTLAGDEEEELEKAGF